MIVSWLLRRRRKKQEKYVWGRFIKSPEGDEADVAWLKVMRYRKERGIIL